MRPCINPVTTGKGTSVEEFLAAARAAGFPAVEISLSELLARGGVQAARDLLARYGVSVSTCGLPVNFRGDEATFREGLRGLPDWARQAAALGIRACCTWLPPATTEPVAEYTLRLVRRLRACASIVADYGLRLGLEWVGPATMREGKNPWVHDIPGTLELVAAVDRPGVGLLVDSFHWYTSGAGRAELQAIPAAYIVHVHINDAPARPLAEQMDQERLLPGEGVIDLRTFLQVLAAKGYGGDVSIETFGQELPALGVQEAARRARAALERVWRDAGLAW